MLQKLILYKLNPIKLYKVETDISNFTIGRQLEQKDKEGQLHPIAFFLQKL